MQCACRHARRVHLHYRRGTDCSADGPFGRCMCWKFRWRWWPWNWYGDRGNAAW